ncbi:MAG: hypothetical protein ACE5D3_04670, partial [Candidatus Binatia bacterium]
ASATPDIRAANAMRDAVDDILQSLPIEKRAQALESIQGYFKSMEAVADDLVDLGIFSHRKADMIYVPRQAMALLGDLAKDATESEGLRNGIAALFRDRFTKRRLNVTAQEFEDAIRGLADRHGVALPDVVERDIGTLHLQRLMAHNKTVHHRTLWNKSQKLWKGSKERNANVTRYLNAQLEQIPERSNALQVFLGGGKFKIDGPKRGWSPEMHKLAAKHGWKIEDGKLHVPLKGINYYYKPSLTSHPQNVGFHARNATAALLMGLFDPDIGFGQGVKAFAEAIGVAPVVRKLGADWSPGEVAVFLRAMKGEAADLAKLEGRMVGKHKATEVVEQLKGLVGGRISQADVMQEIGAKGALGEFEARTGALGAYDRWTKVGENIASHMESSFRASAYMDLVSKGVNPTEAARRVERAFVKYDINSATERAIRDTFPFARFMIGSAAWTGEFMRRPRLVTPLARVQQSSVGGADILPESVQGGLAIPLWEDSEGEMQYLTSLGTPHEAAFGAVDAATSFEGLRRSGLGAMHPLLKAPLEQATNRNFYFGGETGQYRKSPWWADATGLSQEIDTPSGVRREVPGWVNELTGATPASRSLKYPDTLMDKRKSLGQRVLRAATGMRTVSVDQDKARRKQLAKRAEREVDRGRLYKVPAFGARKLPGGKTPEDLDKLLRALRQTGKRKEKKHGLQY